MLQLSERRVSVLSCESATTHSPANLAMTTQSRLKLSVAWGKRQLIAPSGVGYTSLQPGRLIYRHSTCNHVSIGNNSKEHSA